MIDTDGRLIDPTGNVECFEGDDWQTRLRTDLVAAKINDRVAPAERPCLGRFDNVSSRNVKDPSAYFETIIRSIHETQKSTQGRRRNVALIVHGGLATNEGNLQTARDLTAKMLNDPDAPYPIFINWQSNLGANLFAHLFKVRQGDSKGFKHSFLAPAYLLGGLAKGIGRAPATWFYHYGNEIDRFRARFVHETQNADRVYCGLRDEYVKCLDGSAACDQVIAISKGPFRHTYGEGTKSSVAGATTNAIPLRAYASLLGSSTASGGWWSWLPLKLITAPLLDGLGAPAWDTMIRHVKVGFHNDGVPGELLSESLDGTLLRAYPEGRGGIAQFMRALRDEVQKTSCSADGADSQKCLEWELSLIGHSMGTIMANEILYEFQEGPKFSNIVYMAAACSLRDYEQTVLAYMNRHRSTNMYHLTLHDFAEIRDQYFYEVPPSGSLLVWIDNFLSNPPTLRDRTAGRFVNLMMALPATPRELRSRIHVKTFGVGSELRTTDPQKHGEFNNFTGPALSSKEASKNVVDRELAPPFWDRRFWTAEVDDRPTRRQRCTYEPVFDANSGSR